MRRPTKIFALVLLMGLALIDAIEEEVEALWDFDDYTKAWTVGTKVGEVVPFRLNSCQRYIKQCMAEASNDQGTRIRLLKTRRLGASTLFVRDAQCTAQTRPKCNALSIADTDELPAQWLRLCKEWLGQTPAALRPHTGATNRNEIWYDQLGSRYYIGSQGGTNPGMGDNLRNLHCSEVGFWPDPTKILDNLNPAVPKNDPTVVVVHESTGDVAGSWWEEAWQASDRGDDDYTAIFVPWFMDTDNVMDASDIVAFTADEQQKMRAYSLTREQIAWYRFIVRNEFRGDVEKAHSRYPHCPEEAFMAPGRAGIPSLIIAHHKEQAREPLRRVTLAMIDGLVQAVEYTGMGPCWWVWEEPRADCDYCMGADVAQGKLSDPNDERSERDRSSAAIMNRKLNIGAAEYVGRVTPDEFHRQIRLAYRWYFDAWTLPEANDAGWAVIEGLRGLQHLAMREGPQDALGIHPVTAYGWVTTASNRNYLIDKFIADCWNSPAGLIDIPEDHLFSGKFINVSKRLAGEERTFVTNKAGKREHRAGTHDDVLFAWMLCLMCNNKCPRQKTAIMKMPEPAVWSWEAIEARTAAAEANEGKW